MHIQAENKKEEEKQIGISMLWSKSKVLQLLSASWVVEMCQASKVFLMWKEILLMTQELPMKIYAMI